MREQKRLQHKYGRHFPNLQQALLFDKGNNQTLRQLRVDTGLTTVTTTNNGETNDRLLQPGKPTCP
jgi:hypothetical protein